ncbi:glycerol-1-phosphate dehydrogenase [NAD(P)+] [Paenibacillus montaniterrae]|uniref:Glycerol-1-phosphate dehydrogenase [NAD(P)+] n=1 Tax=Paenibacillus montaniterrae TaxID=429341 RepID=A0A920CTG8_9BACL|nr:sn-glycerol-1-phosphate dehydrogenase [Paenibacillus montaniterrae]GIP15877.1 glycerol-1-phosphate dehydrogenase [NAD(P)+] [Paenibacillus montaniterrae]
MSYTADIDAIMKGLEPEVQASIGMDKIVIEAGALQLVAPYVLQHFQRIMLVVDEHTYKVAGQQLEGELKRDAQSLHTVFITPNIVDDVVADEQSLIELSLAAKQHKPEVLVAVGSGTLHDITRMVGYLFELPFISVPTAPSVDGFNSKGAPIIVRGEKKTIVSIGPNAVFADLHILQAAPRRLIAAGFGDILGKYTSLFDWKFGCLTNAEPYMEQAYTITKQALHKCVHAASLIEAGDQEGIAYLMSGLIESGIAMLIFGKSHPASGAEHHVSHYWEMSFIKQGRKQLLHGAKVGVSCILIAELYHRLAAEDFGLRQGVRDSVRENWQQIKELVAEMPSAVALKEMLGKVGGATTVTELGISQELAEEALRSAHHVRPERYTLLHAFNTTM